MQRLTRVDIEAPVDLRDMVWTPAHLTLQPGCCGRIDTHPLSGSENSTDSAVQLARRTDWEQPVEDFYLGSGQRMFATDRDNYPLLSTRRILFHSDDTGAANWRTPSHSGSMGSKYQEQLQPSLLDRLTDDEPGKTQESAEADDLHASTAPGGAARSLLAAEHDQPCSGEGWRPIRRWRVRSSITASRNSPGIL